MTFSDQTTIERERVFCRPVTEAATTQQTTADAAQIIENKINQEADKLRSRLAELVRLRVDAGLVDRPRREAEIADLRDCVKLMKDGGAMIAAALFDAN